MSTSTKLSRFFLTIAGLCTALGGMQAFQAFGDSTPAAHKVTSIIMGIGVVCAYLASSPLIKGTDAAKPVSPPKVTAILVFFAFLGTAVASCAHIKPVAACASDIVVQAIKDAFADPNWEVEVAQLAIEDGPAVIECVVEQIIAESSHTMGTATGGARVAHARAWKAAHSK